MYAPKLYETEVTRDMIQTFGGYNHNIRISDNEFYDMKNLTSANYPTLSPRNKRGMVKRIEGCNGLLAKDELAYVEGNTLHYGELTMELRQTGGDRQLVSMGAYIVVCPDMMYLNTSDPTDFGECSEEFGRIDGTLSYSVCDKEGNAIVPSYYKTDEGVTAPADAGYILVGQPVYTEYEHSSDHHTEFHIVDDEGMPSKTVVFSLSVWNSYAYSNEYFEIHIENNCYVVTYLQVSPSDRYFDVLIYTDTPQNGGTVLFNHAVTVKSPDSPVAGEYMADCTAVPPVMRVCRDGGEWTQTDTCVKIELTGMWGTVSAKQSLIAELVAGRRYLLDFSDISGDNGALTCFTRLYESRRGVTLVSTTAEVSSAGKVSGCLIFSGVTLYGTAEASVRASVSVRDMYPVMDHMIEAENRLWGCRYGPDMCGNFVNEIYASALGSFGLWQKYEGLSTDSYTVSLGTDGPFTGAVNYRGRPMFFKENCCHIVYGSYPAAYQVVTDTGLGLRKGDSKSLCVLKNALYYKSADGIYVYDGASADKISDALGLEAYSDAVAGAVDSRYYVAMTDENGVRALFVYDADKGLWHREDGADARYFARYAGDLWYYDGDTRMLCTVKGTRGDAESGDVEWFAETGIMGYSTPDAKYVGKVQMRVMLPAGSKISLYIEYDSDGYMEFKGGIEGKSFHAFTIPVMPRRCDHFKLRIEGVGECRIFSISKVLEEGGGL